MFIVEITNKRVWINVECKANNQELYPASYFPFFGYIFPDDDFCLFARFPHQKIIILHVIGEIKKCSCTALWIYKYFAFYAHHKLDRFLGYSTEMVKVCNVNNYSAFEAAYNACNMTKRYESFQTVSAQMELSQTIDNYQGGYFFLYDLQGGISKANDYLVKKLGPWVSAFSLMTRQIYLL